MAFFRTQPQMITADNALPGREGYAFPVPETHDVSGHRIAPPYPNGLRTAVFGLGCFWGAERLFWQAPGVYSTAVGYAGGFTPFPTYDEVCSGLTGHAESVLVVFDPAQVTYAELLSVFFQGHDPTQGMRQGNDVGTQYRSAIYWTDEAQHEQAEKAAAAYTEKLAAAGMGAVTSEISPAGQFYYAEEYHQQYLHKNPGGYCGLGGTGVACPVGLFAAAG